VAYSSVPPADWEPFARLVLRATYDAILLVAATLAADRAAAALAAARAAAEDDTEHAREDVAPTGNEGGGGGGGRGGGGAGVGPEVRVRVFLTLVGGGVFGNEPAWITDAIGAALDAHAAAPLDVFLVHYGPEAGRGVGPRELPHRGPRREAE
jgi:hypothetical protein